MPLIAIPSRLGFALTLELACFAVDVNVPRDYSVWLFYFFPLFLIWETNARSISVTVATAILFLMVGLFLASPGHEPLIVNLIARLEGVVIFWIFGFLSIGRLRNVEVLMQREEQVRRQALILEQVQDAVVTIDNEQRIQYMNQAAYRNYDIDPEEPVMGSKLGEFFRFEWQSPQQLEGYLRSIQETGVWKGEKIHVTHKGRRIWGESVISLTKDSRGNPTGVAAVVRDVTQRKRAEAALEENRERLRLANEAAGIGTWSIDLGTGIIDWDATTRDHWGFLHEEVLSLEKIKKRLIQEDQSKLDESILAISNEKTISTLEVRIRCPDGSIRHLRSTGRSTKGSNGRIIRVFGTSLDITDQKEREQALRDYAEGLDFLSGTATRMLQPLELPELFKLITERIYSLAEGAIVVFSEFDPVNRKTFVREIAGLGEEIEAVRRILKADPIGFPLDISEAVRRRMISGELSRLEGGLFELSFYQVPQTICNEIERALNIREVHTMPCVLGHDLLGTVAVMTHGQGGLRKKNLIESIVSQSSLALQRKRLEQQLRNALAGAEEGKNILTALMEHIPIGIAIADAPEVSIRMVSRYGLETLKQPEEELAGKSLGKPPFKMGVFHTDGATPALPEELPLRRAMNNGEIVNNEEWIVVGKDGTFIPILCSAAPIRNREGKIVGGVLGWHEIAERRKLENELRKRAGELEYANRELESFSYSVTHDLRSPLQALIGFGAILKEDYAERLNEDGRNLIDRILRNGKKLDSLIDDILNLSKVAGQELRIEKIDLSRVAESVIAELRKEHPDRQVRTTVQQGCGAAADARLMLIALTNLIGNAWKYTLRTRDPQIEFGCMQKSGQPVFFVRDNGAGFDMKQADKLFIPFRRLHTDRDFAGTGVGLATVARIISRHGGRIWAEAEVGKGATFYFTLG